MIDLLSLPWLRNKSPETSALLSDAQALRDASLQDLVRMAQERLAPSDIRKLAQAARFDRERARKEGLTPVRLCVASQTTTDFLGEHIVAAGLRFGLLIGLVETEFNQLADLAFGDFFADESHADIDFTFLGLDYRQLRFREDFVGDATGAEAELAHKLGFVRQIVEGIHAKTGVPCIVQNLVPEPQEWVSSIDRDVPGSMRSLVAAFNSRLQHEIGPAHCVFDAEHLAADVGLSRWHDPGMWFLAKLGCSSNAFPLLAHRLAAILAAARGKSKRVLVLDLDNTLWGGVIGDDGVGGIKVGLGSAAGEAFLGVQRMARSLKERGVVLAVSSKNSEPIARQAFEEHTGMALRLDDFAAFQVNWEDKASNIRHIASLLELGLDSFVFLDDNPVERDIVRRNLPAVAVPELGSNPAEYVRIVMAAGYFESIAFSAEDRRRADMYRENANRSLAMEKIGDMDAYLESLNMRLEVRAFDQSGRSRIAQLINKSNQFNLTTHRYSETEVERLEHDPQAFTVQASLVDAFGDNGMICVVICLPELDHWTIDSWLMSCRVLKRRVEEQILQYLVDEAASRGIKRLKGVYKATPRNGIVRDHYRSLGFTRCESSTPEEEIWWLDVASFTRNPLPFALVLGDEKTAPTQRLENA